MPTNISNIIPTMNVFELDRARTLAMNNYDEARHNKHSTCELVRLKQIEDDINVLYQMARNEYISAYGHNWYVEEWLFE